MEKTIFQLRNLTGDEYEVLYWENYPVNGEYLPIRYQAVFDGFEVYQNKEWKELPHKTEVTKLTWKEVCEIKDNLNYKPIYQGDQLLGAIPIVDEVVFNG